MRLHADHGRTRASSTLFLALVKRFSSCADFYVHDGRSDAVATTARRACLDAAVVVEVVVGLLGPGRRGALGGVADVADEGVDGGAGVVHGEGAVDVGVFVAVVVLEAPGGLGVGFGEVVGGSGAEVGGEGEVV